MDSSISGNGFPSSLKRHGYRTSSLYIDDEPEIRSGYIQRSLESEEVLAPPTSSPSHTFKGEVYRPFLDQNNPLPT